MTNGKSSVRIVFRDKFRNNFNGGFFVSEKILVTQERDEQENFRVDIEMC